MLAPTVPVPASRAPEFTVTAEFAIEPFTISVPELTAVAPEYVLLPDSVSVPPPILVRAPGPESVPERVRAFACVSTVSVPLSSIPSARDSPLAAACSVVPFAKMKAPVPSALLDSTASVAALSAVPPE